MFIIADIGTKNYYTDSQSYLDKSNPEKLFDYLVTNNSIKPYFTGGLSSEYGLQKEYDPNECARTFERLYDGYKPDGTKAIKNAGAEDHQAGKELLLTMPKSLSVLWALSDEHGKKQIEADMEYVNKEMMKLVEKDLKPSNMIEGHKKIKRVDAIIATYSHYENRNKDPHIHKHNLVFNQARFEFEDGTSEIRAVDFNQVYKKTREYTSIANAMLQARIEQRGHRTIADEQNAHSFKIAGIPDELCDKFSERRDEVLQWAKENKLNFTSFEEASEAHTKWQKEQVRKCSAKDKEELTYNELLDVFKQKLDAEHFNYEQYQQNNINLGPRQWIAGKEGLTKIDDKMAAEIEDAIVSKNGIFTRTQFNVEIINSFKNRVKLYSPELVQMFADEAFKIFSDKSKVIEIAPGQFTTQNVINTENRLVDLAKQLSSNKSVAYPDHALDSLVDAFEDMCQTEAVESGKQFSLNNDQRQACMVIAEGSNLVSITGDAGSGKTSSCIRFANVLYSDNSDVYGLSIATGTANALKSAGISKTNSITDFLYQYESNKITIDPQKPPCFIVDESGMVDSKQMCKLLEIANKHNGKMILVGDPKQFSSVDYGCALNNINANIPASNQARLEQNMRQQNEVAKSIAENFRDKEVDKALNTMRDNRLLHVSKNESDTLDKLVGDYFADSTAIDKKGVIAGQNSTVNQLNDRIRSRLIENGTIDATNQVFIPVIKTPSKVLTEERGFAVNDSIILKQNTKIGKNLKLENGTRATIKSIENTDGKVFLNLSVVRQGMEIEVKLDTGKHNNFSHGYASTSYKSQGQTLDNVYVYSNGKTTANQAYVEFSRHKEKVQLYITDENLALFQDNAKKSQDKFNALHNQKCIEAYKQQEELPPQDPPPQSQSSFQAMMGQMKKGQQQALKKGGIAR